MNADQLKGKWTQFKGELKQQWGKFTDDDLQQIEGNYDKFVGKVRERYGDKKDELMKWADQWHQRSQSEAKRVTAGSLAAILLLMGAMSSCESSPQVITDHKDTAIGAGVGGASGAVIGGLAGGTEGAIIGGLVGALAGGAIGNYIERQDKDRSTAASATGYQASQGNVVRVDNVEASPSTVRSGDTVNLTSTYTILTPNNQTMAVQETREVRHDGALVANTTVNTRRANGTFTSTVPITLPSTAQSGTYDVTTTVAMGDRISRSMTTFTVQ